VNFVKNLENADKKGFINGKWYPHPSPEGGYPTIAYGHKIKTDKEEQKYRQGLDDREATKLLVKDLMEAKDKVRKYIDDRYKIHLMLDKKQMEMLTDFAFNLGGLEKFPKFTDAVLRKDWKRAAQEYKRGYRSASGERKELTRRNQLFFDRYLK
jgi:GH24 family phage-related lysozyme (muramidase)